MAAIPLKIVVLGDGGVGKSSITMSILKRAFSDEYDPTIEDSYSVSLNLDGQAYDVEILDTAGQEEYRGMWDEQNVREGDGFVFVYSIDSETSFELLPSFIHTIRKVISPEAEPSSEQTPENTPFPFMALGNKCDLPPASRKIPAATGLAFTRSLGGLFNECSAKMGVNIESGFGQFVKACGRVKIAKEAYIKKYGSDEGFNGNIVLSENSTNANNGGGGTVRLADDEKPPQRGKKNPDLSMDRRRSFSVGGLGRDPSELNKSDRGGCCIVA